MNTEKILKQVQKEHELLVVIEKANDEYNKAFHDLPLNLSISEMIERMEPYSLKVAEASRSYRKIQTPNYIGDIPKYGYVMTLKKFISCCKSGGFIDSDGYGNYVKDGQETDIAIHPSDVKHKAVRRDFTEIIWYNK